MTADAKAYCTTKFDAAGAGATGAYQGVCDQNTLLFPIRGLGLKRTLKGHVRKVTCLGWKDSTSESVLVGADQNNKVILWDAKSEMKRQIYSASFVMSADVHPIKDLVVVGSMQNTCAIVDMSMPLPEGQKKRDLQGHDGYVGSVKWIESGSKIISAGGDAEVKLWDAEKGCEIATMYGHEIDAGSVSFPREVEGSHVFCTASTDKTVKMWDLRLAGQPNACVMTFDCEGEVNTCAMFPNGNAVVAGCETCERGKAEGRAPADWENITGAATFLDVRTGCVITKFTRKRSKCTGVAWSASGRILFVSYEDGQVGLWDPWCEGAIKHKISAHADPSATTKNTNSVVSSMVMSPDGQVLATAGFDGLIKIWGACD